MRGENPTKRRRAVTAAAWLAAFAAAYWGLPLLRRPGGQVQPPPASAPSSLSPPPAAVPADAGARLARALQALQAARGPAGTKQALDDLRRALRTLPADQASAAISRFLESKTDQPTGQEFKVGAAGALESAPTLRTFLLDQLGQLDPAAAAANARVILASMDSPDEWAVALRNLARGDTSEDGRRLAGDKLRTMLTHPAWLEQPSVGFLEAFDVAVHLHATELIPTLTDLVRLQDNQAAAHAAYLSLDRMTIADPTVTLSALQANPDSMKGREVTRANYFARADVRDEAQRRVIETYLLNPALTTDELEKFSALYPNANFMVSRNLLTESATPDNAWLTGRDRAALTLLKQWAEEPRFTRLRPQLQQMELRLQQFVRQSGQK